jgi:hypothetical protein
MAQRPSTDADVARGIPLFLDQLVLALVKGAAVDSSTHKAAGAYGEELFRQGFSVTQVVHDYGNVCQSVIDLAAEMPLPISAADYHTLDQCLDNAIAGTVSAYNRHQQRVESSEARALLALIDEAITAFDRLHAGALEVAGTPAAVVHRSLHRIRLRVVGRQ